MFAYILRSDVFLVFVGTICVFTGLDPFLDMIELAAANLSSSAQPFVKQVESVKLVYPMLAIFAPDLLKTAIDTALLIT